MAMDRARLRELIIAALVGLLAWTIANGIGAA